MVAKNTYTDSLVMISSIFIISKASLYQRYSLAFFVISLTVTGSKSTLAFKTWGK